MRLVRNIVVAVVAVTVCVAIAGTAYLFFSQRQVNATTANASTPSGQSTLHSRALPAANAKEGVAIEALQPEARAGSTMSVVAVTNATSLCSITVDLSVVAPTDVSLAPRTADSYGTVSWSWSVRESAPIGNKTLTITCKYGKSTGVVMGSFAVVQ